MTSFRRTLLLSSLVAGLALANACEGTNKGLPSNPGGGSAGGATTGLTGNGGSGGGAGSAGAGGVATGISATGGAASLVTGGAGRTDTGGMGGSITGGAGQSGMSGVAGSITGGAGRSGTSGMGGSVVGGIGGSTFGVCDEAPCLASLFLPCQPLGTCTTQETTTTTAETTITLENYCYSNGSKVQTTMYSTGAVVAATYMVKHNGVVCYRIDGNLSNMSAISYVFRDANENQVATATLDVSTVVITATCDGGTSTPLSDACLNATGNVDSCITGACAF